MAAQAICCGYYGVFVVPDGRLRDHSSSASTRRLWRSAASGLAIAVGGASSRSLLVTPAFLPYLTLQRAADSAAS